MEFVATSMPGIAELLADELVVVESISYQTVKRTLKKRA